MPTGLWSLNTDACCSCYYKSPLRETWSSSEKARGKSRSRQKWHMLHMSISVNTAKYSATPMSPGREHSFWKIKKKNSEKKIAVRKNKFKSQIHLSTSKLFHFQRLHLPVCRDAGRIKNSERKKKKNKYSLKGKKKKRGDTASNWTVSWQTSESCCSYGRTGETS